jgi:hypothetical protein
VAIRKAGWTFMRITLAKLRGHFIPKAHLAHEAEKIV